MAIDTAIAAGTGFQCLMHPAGPYSLELLAGERPLLRLGRLKAGGCDEDGALVKKVRRHGSLDGLSVALESAAVIPFGCEYEVGRTLEVIDGAATLITDVAAVNRGLVQSVELEPVTFPGPWCLLEFLIYGENTWRRQELARDADPAVFFEGRELVASVRLTAEDGAAVEFNAGGDLWRHRTAMHRPEVAGGFTLSGGAHEVTLTRHIFTYPTELTVEKRPWRFKNSFGWKSGGSPAASGASAASGAPGSSGAPGVDGETEATLCRAERPLALTGMKSFPGSAVECPCLTSAVARRAFRGIVRHGGGDLRVGGAVPGFCVDAAHLERPGKGELEHGDLDDFIRFYLWGNRQLCKSGGRLRFATVTDGLFASSVVMKNLSRYPGRLHED